MGATLLQGPGGFSRTSGPPISAPLPESYRPTRTSKAPHVFEALLSKSTLGAAASDLSTLFTCQSSPARTFLETAAAGMTAFASNFFVKLAVVGLAGREAAAPAGFLYRHGCSLGLVGSHP